MLENIENSFKDLLASVQTAKLYGSEHSIFHKSVDKAYASLMDVLSEREELTIGIVGEELAFEKEIFFELSQMVRPAIIYLKDKGIEKLSFSRGLEREELSKFITFLAAPKEGVERDPQEHLSLMGIANIKVGKLKASSPAKAEEALTFLNIYQSALDKTSQTVEGVLNAQAIDQLSFRFAINNVMEKLIKHHQQLLKLTTLKRYDPGTFVHLINVSILSMFFSSKLGFAKDAVLDIGVAALFHDIGKLYISGKILRKSEGLTEEEFSRIKSHTTLGSALLLQYVDTLGILPVVVSFEHHLKYNLKGYPKLSVPLKPHIASMIVSICDVYDALLERRSYKADYTPDMIYNLMVREKGTSFEPALVDKFFTAVGVWPIGSIVSLSDGRIAVVIEENEDDIMSPKVEVIHPADKKEIIDLKGTKETIKIARFLNPWKEGKEFLHLIEAAVPLP
jgi:HD-GYP domain-containing protein (c-di-GMP phosphodiesterase class II)